MESINWQDYSNEYFVMRQIQRCFEQKAYSEAEKGLQFLLDEFVASEKTQYLILLQKLMFYVIGWKAISENRNLEWAQQIWDLRTEIEIFIEETEDYLTPDFIQNEWQETFDYAKEKFEFEYQIPINFNLSSEEVFHHNYKIHYPLENE